MTARQAIEIGTRGGAAVLGRDDIGALAAGKSADFIAIDINPSKFELAKQFGATDCVNPKEHTASIQEVIVEMTDGGFDYKTGVMTDGEGIARLSRLIRGRLRVAASPPVRSRSRGGSFSPTSISTTTMISPGARLRNR